ncbi:uncharacterized protein LOC110885508 [Helianthus annuus]|uniref:uncharacterized protein LOC110885508 n=1 Tax=Helianthus annuus TaxID=4232 RepID=UPI001652B822|nr:uncharacterized protein LOC110885508 [Helianthus annuus]
MALESEAGSGSGRWLVHERGERRWLVENVVLYAKKTLSLNVLQGAKIQAGIKSHLIPVFDGQLQEDVVVILSKFGVDWQGVEYGFNFRAYEDILQGEALNALSVDVVGSVICCGDLEIFDRPPNETKKMNFNIEDLEGKVLRCTVWNDYALQIKDFISKIPPLEHVMAVIQHEKCKEWKGEYTVQSDKFATRIFLNEEIDEVNKLRRRKCLVFLQEMSCVVVATIKIVQEEYDDILRLPATSLVYIKCYTEFYLVSYVYFMFKVQVRVQDESGSVSFVMFDRDVQKLLGLAASDIRERQAAFKIDVSEFNLKNDYRVYTVQKTCDDPVIIAELVGGDGNGDENTEEVTQEVAGVKDVSLSESSQVSAERTSWDVVSVTADSSAVEVEKDSRSSPNGKRMAQDADVVNVDELFTNV